MKDELSEHSAQLRRWAKKLASQSSGIPVLVSDICASLGIKIRRSDKVPQFKSYLSVDPSADQPTVILLPNDGNGRSAFARFCVAHEVGHYLLLKGFKALPKSRSEYWRHEDVCDEFARHLLVPETWIEGMVRSLSTPHEYLELCRAISAQSRVPWIHAGIRIAETVGGVHYLRFGCVNAKNPALGPNAKSFKVISTSLPNHRGRAKIINESSPLHLALGDLLKESKRLERRLERDFTQEFLRCDAMQDLFETVELVAAAEGVPNPYGDGETDVWDTQLRCAVMIPNVSMPIRKIKKRKPSPTKKKDARG